MFSAYLENIYEYSHTHYRFQDPEDRDIERVVRGDNSPKRMIWHSAVAEILREE